MKVILSLLFIVLALVGITDSGYITYEELTGGVVQCGTGFDCGKVLKSSYAYIGPVPLAALGLVFYTTFFILGIVHFLEIQLPILPYLKKVTWSELFLLLGSTGFVFSLYLVSLMAFILNAWCKFCLISALTSTSLFILSLGYYLLVGKKMTAKT